MTANRADFRSFFTLKYETAVAAFPQYRGSAAEYFAGFDVRQQRFVAFFMTLFNQSNTFKLTGNLIVTFLVRFFRWLFGIKDK